MEMKLHHRILPVFICMLLVIAFFPLTAHAEEEITEEDFLFIDEPLNESITWSLSSDGKLTVSGYGDMPVYAGPNLTPWESEEYYCADLIESIVIGSGITSVGDYSFTNLPYVAAVDLPAGLQSIGTWAFGRCSSLGSIIIPAGCVSVGGAAFQECAGLRSVIISDSCRTIGDYAFAGCTSLRSVSFGGDAPAIGEYSFQGVTAAVWCSCLKSGWDENTMLQYGAEKLTWSRHAYDDGVTVSEPTCTEDGVTRYTCSLCGTAYEEATPATGHTVVTDPAVEPTAATDGLTEGSHCSVCGEIIVAQETVLKSGYIVDLSAIPQEKTVEIDGIPYDRSEQIVITGRIPGFAVAYEYAESKGADQTKLYPASMKVYRLSLNEAEHICTAEEFGALDDLLGYKGFSIRVTGVSGIRMLTAVRESLKSYLIATGVEGYKLTEYGTLVQWESELAGAALTFETPGVRHAAAYEQGKSDPVFARSGASLIYTNVLVGFTEAQCGQELAMRPYMKLQNDGGDQIVFYGGTLHRSIGFIALQNKDVYTPGTGEYEYIWKLIRAAYGSAYDSGYKKG